LELNAIRRRRSAPPVVGYQGLCRELAAAGPRCFGELSSVAARSVLRRYADSWFAAAKARREGNNSARFPRRRRHLLPLRFYAGTFSCTARRLRLPVAAGAAPLVLRLARPMPYPPSQVRSVTLGQEGGRLHVDVTAEVPLEDHDLDPGRIAGVDLGIIHPYALAGPDEALVVSGRALRAEARLHLADAKARQRVMSRRAPSPGRAGSRRWRKLRARRRRIEARHRRRLRQAHHEAAGTAVAWAVEQRLGTMVVGDLRGITATDAGPRHNLALRNWRPGHLLSVLRDKAEVAGITVALVDERGTSSTCPQCSSKVSKPKGRVFSCPRCGYGEHRDVVGARNIAARGGGSTSAPALVTHRRAGRHLPGRTRRDPRRVRNGQSLGSLAGRGPLRCSGESLVEHTVARRGTADRRRMGRTFWLRH
jgi:putative transposase